jgi:hypothetical protein
VSFQHWFYAFTQRGYHGNGRQLSFGIGQYIPLEKVGKEMFFEEYLDFRSQYSIVGFRCI